MDLVFRDAGGPALFWVGPMTRAEAIAAPAPAEYVGLRFAPGVAPALAGVDARDVLDRDLAEDDARLLDALAAAGSGGARRALLLAAVAARRARAAAPDRLVVAAAAAVLRAGGDVRVAALARAAGVSERTLHRRFLAAVGYGPKRLCRVARLGAARALAARGLAGADLAAAAGYFDQAHLCHELASFGVSATSLAA
jgi:AraC-like DNA-binding protein